jgi:penicillin-binding protein 1A
LRSLWQFLFHGRLQGASTIEQQLVRTLTCRYERTLHRKFREILLAACVSELLSKPEVLTAYLSVAYFGWGMQGLNRACRVLGFDRNSISANQAAALIARLKYPQPREWNPPWQRQVRRRAKHVLGLLDPSYSPPRIVVKGEPNEPLPLQD